MREVPAGTRMTPFPDPALAGCPRHVGAGLVPARYGFPPQTVSAHEERPHKKHLQSERGGNVDSSNRMTPYAHTLVR